MIPKKIIIAALALAILCYSASFAFVQVNASPGRWYVGEVMPNGSYPSIYYGVRGYNSVQNQTIVYGSGVASFYGVVQPNDDWLAMGIFQGHNALGHYFTNPQFYYDYMRHGVKGIIELGSAPLGINVQYGVYTSRQFLPPWPPPGDAHATWYAYNSYLPSTYSVTDFYYAWGAALAESESHDNQNTLNYHYWGCQYATMGLNYYDFQSPGFAFQSPPYYYFTGTHIPIGILPDLR